MAITREELMRALGRPMNQNVQQAPAPAQAPAPQPMAPEQGQRPRGLLGGFFGPDGRDARARLAIGLEGLTLNPNQALIGQLQQGIEGRETAAQKNKTVEWLRSQGREDLATAIEGGLPAADALRIAMTPADPMAAINMERAQLELERLRNPQAGYRQVKGADLGLTGAEAEKLFNVSPEGQVTAIGGSGTTVNIDNKAASKFEEEFAKGDAATLRTVYDTGLQAARNIGRIDQLEALLASAPQGAQGAIKLAAGEFGINTEGLNDLQTAQALINSLVPEQRQPGSGPMSDADLALFKQSLPRIINQPGGNQTIINTMRAIAEYDAQGASIVQRMRLPTTDPNHIDSATAFEMLQTRPNPLAQQGAIGGGNRIRYDENGNRIQ